MAGEIVSVLFTDLVGSTDLADRLGDAAAETVRRTHFGLLRGAITAHGGREVKNLGDGLMVVFPSALDAVAAGRAMQRAVARHNAAGEGTEIHVRIGVHVGEPIRAEGDYFGTAVNIAARLCAAAGADEIVVSALVAELVGARGTVEFRSMGELTLKGISRPVAAAVVLWSPDDPDDLTVPQPRSLSTRIPVPSSELVGRDAVLDAVIATLEHARLVTLTGQGGMGKTRLSLAVLARWATGRILVELDDEPGWCELGPVLDPEGVTFALAGAVGVTQQPGMPLQQALLEALAPRRMLLVVDNCEHVLDGIVPLLERLLATCPQVRVLASSRERLALDGETVIEIPPLDVTADGSALVMLRDRVAAIRPGFDPDERARAALLEIAQRLDGLPLALELAAARIASLGAVEVAARLDQRFALLTGGRRTAPERHRTLRSTVEWSYDLLEPAERRVFERASLFVGGFTLEAAEAVCTVDGGWVADVVATLVDKSILIVEDRGWSVRYRMLETLREFGLERLAAEGQLDGAAATYARYYADLATRAAPEVIGPAEAEWVERLNAETGNLRHAYLWARAAEPRMAARLCAGLVWFSFIRMRLDLLAWADAPADDDPPTAGEDLPTVLFSAGMGAALRADGPRAMAMVARVMATVPDGPDRRWGHLLAGAMALTMGRLSDAADHMSTAAALADEVGDRFLACRALGALALSRAYAGDSDTAIKHAGEARAAALAEGSPSALAWAEYTHGEALVSVDPQAALERFGAAIDLARPVQAHFIRTLAMVAETSVRVRHSDVRTAADALREVIDALNRAGNWRQLWVTLRHAAVLLERAGDDRGLAILLGALVTRDSGLYGADAERLAALRADLLDRLGAEAEAQFAEGQLLAPVDLVEFALDRIHRVAAS